MPPVNVACFLSQPDCKRQRSHFLTSMQLFYISFQHFLNTPGSFTILLFNPPPAMLLQVIYLNMPIDPSKQ